MERKEGKRIVAIRAVGRRKVYDLSVQDAESYVLENGVISHNTGSIYNSDNIWIVGRQQEKDGDEVSGYNFIINIEKSRYVKEKSKIPITVSFEGGINKWSGMFDLAVDAGYIVSTKKGWYNLVDPETKQPREPAMRASQFNTNEIWYDIFKTTDFAKYIENKYKLPDTQLNESE